MLLENPPAVGALDQYIEEIDGLVQRALGDLDEFGAATPEVATRCHRVLRLPDRSGWLLDRVLELVAVDDQTWSLTYHLGDAGFEPGDGAPIMTGELIFDGSERQNFCLAIDLDAAAAVDPEIEGRGSITLQARTLDDGTREVWCDIRDAGAGRSSFTTYRLAPDRRGSLEYVDSRELGSTRVTASWDGDAIEIASALTQRAPTPAPAAVAAPPKRLALGSGVHDTSMLDAADTLVWSRARRPCA